MKKGQESQSIFIVANDNMNSMHIFICFLGTILTAALGKSYLDIFKLSIFPKLRVENVTNAQLEMRSVKGSLALAMMAVEKDHFIGFKFLVLRSKILNQI